MRLLLCLAFGCWISLASAQVPMVHMHYNLTLYGNPFACNENNNSTDEKDEALRTIISFEQPDILTVNEIRDQQIWPQRILDNVLNAQESLWERADFLTQVTGSSILNAFFYRSDRYVLHDQDYVSQALDGSSLLRPIDLYTVYPINASLADGDTSFVTYIVAHLSASDPIERADQTEALMARLDELGSGNYIFTGDLNIDASFEEAFQILVSDPNIDLAFVDPVNLPSVWNNNSVVSQYHTQSTRFSDTNNGCFAPGGLDDRFDITLISPSIEQGTESWVYLSDSYRVVGQSGNDYNQELQTFNNQVVPDAIAQALYNLSDHLPVVTSYMLTNPVGLGNALLDQAQVRLTEYELTISLPQSDTVRMEVFDLSGRLLLREAFSGKYYNQSRTMLPHNQVLLLRLISVNGASTHVLAPSF